MPSNLQVCVYPPWLVLANVCVPLAPECEAWDPPIVGVGGSYSTLRGQLNLNNISFANFVPVCSVAVGKMVRPATSNQ